MTLVGKKVGHPILSKQYYNIYPFSGLNMGWILLGQLLKSDGRELQLKLSHYFELFNLLSK